MGFDPATLAIMSMVATGGSAVVGAIGQEQQAKAASQSANYNAGIARNNAIVQQRNAALAGAEGEESAATAEMSTRAREGAILANQGASGVDVNSGSAVDVRTSAAELGELNAINIRAGAARQAYGYQQEATSQQNQAKLDEAQAKYDREAGDINAFSTLLGGTGQAAGNYGKFLQDSSFTGSNGMNDTQWNSFLASH